MFARILVAGILAASIATGYAAAQTATLPSTQVMREQAEVVYRSYNRIVKGDAAYDAAKVSADYEKLTAATAKLRTAFPESSKGKTSPKSRYAASPKTWTMPEEFRAEQEKLEKVLRENKSKIGTPEGLKVATNAINQACNSCHDTFRVRTN